MPILGYTISPARMTALLATPSGNPNFTIMGLLFKIKTPANVFLNDIEIYPIFSDGENSIIDVGYHQNLLEQQAGGTYNAFNYDATGATPHPDPTQPELYLGLETFASHPGDIPYFTFFDAPSLQISVGQASEFIVSGASCDTATLLGNFGDNYKSSTLKIEVILPAKYPHGNPGPHDRKAPSYLMGLPCHDTWYDVKN